MINALTKAKLITKQKKHQIRVHESNEIIWNKCILSCKGKHELITQIKDKHPSYKPCIKFGAGYCDTVNCRFRHIKLSGNQEICYKCGHKSESITENMNHIKSMHGNEICYKFIKNQCVRSSENCLFTHKIKQNVSRNITPPTQEQQDFQEGPTSQLHSPRVGMPTMSEHIQNQQRIKISQGIKTPPVNIIDMIPQIVSQVIIALTQMQTEAT